MGSKRVHLFVYVGVVVSVNALLYGLFQFLLNYECSEKGNTLIRVQNSRLFIYSAVAVFIDPTFEEAQKSKQLYKFNAIAISAFEIGNESLMSFRCCYMLKKGPMTSRISSQRNNYIASAIRRGIQLICPLWHNLSDVQSVALTFENSICPKEKQNYKEVIIPTFPVKRHKQEKTIAVCAKLCYGNFDADRLVEWLETLRLFGVDRVFSHLYMLNGPAREVFQFYEKAGFAEVMEFDLPHKEIQPTIDTNNRQGWNDEQVALFNCEARLLMYDYVVVIDTDEFLVPKANMFKNGWRILFDEVFRKPEVATVYFWTVLHITMWGPTNPRHPLFIGKYNNCTVPLIDKVKLVYTPTKVEFGSVSTHENTPFKGFKRNAVDPNEAVLHHYRSCRSSWLEIRSTENKDWLEGNDWTKMDKKDDNYFFYTKEEMYCYDFRRFYSKEIDHLTEVIKTNVSRILITLRESGSFYK